MNIVSSHGLNPPHDDHGAGKLEEAMKVCCIMFVTDDNAPEVLDPRIQGFDLIAMSIATKWAAVLSGWFNGVGAMRTDQFDVPCPQSISQRHTVRSAVINQRFGGLRQQLPVQERPVQTSANNPDSRPIPQAAPASCRRGKTFW